MNIELPISKSIANRIQIREALRGNRRSVPSDAPEDVLVLEKALSEIEEHVVDNGIITINVGNCGTAMRFLTAYCAQKAGCNILLTSCERMKHRPIGQLVNALINIGADISYKEKEGFPPLLIHGRNLSDAIKTSQTKPIILNDPESTQFISALMLIGLKVSTNCLSPYITMTQQVIDNGELSIDHVEKDWSSAAFWYEDVALNGGSHTFPKLNTQSLQGDKVLAEIYEELGVSTTCTEDGVCIKRKDTPSLINTKAEGNNNTFAWDFTNCPDLYPAVAITCDKLGISTNFTGTEHLRIKESDRLESVERKVTSHDHRMAMALLVAGYEIDDAECIRKSYPQFVFQWLERCGLSIIIPRKGVNDDNKGKKYALQKLISAATTPYVWLTDDDTNIEETVYSLICSSQYERVKSLSADLYIMSLTMTGGDSLLERLQKIEYKGIQNLTMYAAQKGHAVMCSGANLIVKKERWLESYSDLHPEISSGDDMFLLESFKRRGLRIDSLDITLSVKAVSTWREFWKQRMRWAGKAPAYTDKDIKKCGACVVILNMLCILCPILYIPKYLIERQFVYNWSYDKLNTNESTSNDQYTKKDGLLTILLSLCYPWYMLICLIGGMIRKKW